MANQQSMRMNNSSSNTQESSSEEDQEQNSGFLLSNHNNDDNNNNNGLETIDERVVLNNNNNKNKKKKKKKKSKKEDNNKNITTTTTTTTTAEEFSVLKRRMRITKLFKFWTVKSVQLLCVSYILLLTFSFVPIGLVDRETGDIVDLHDPKCTRMGVISSNGSFRPVVARGSLQQIYLAISRMSAFSMYPVLILVFLSKCKATVSFFNRTPLSMYMIQDTHELHSFAGTYIAFDALIHTLFHILRWADQGNLYLLWKHNTGLSGLFVVIITPIITLPMMYFKKSLSYEFRKGLHYFFFLFAFVICFHVPMSAFPNGGFIAPVMAFCLALYAIDAMYVFLFMTEKIETTVFHVLPSGVQMTMAVSQTFQQRRQQGGFCYVCLPWVDKNQWHAFSLFEHPADPTQRQVFMQNVGDWTQAVHEALQRKTSRPVWVQGPFASPYNNAEEYDNQILVASGIGITPALSVIQAHKTSRRTNLVWAVRDSAMLEFFLEHMYLDHDGWNLIFYTGKKPLNPILHEMNTNVRIIKGRPDLDVVIPNIIYGIESGTGLPEKYVPTQLSDMEDDLIDKLRELDAEGAADNEDQSLSSNDKLFQLTSFAQENGYLFTDFVERLDDSTSSRNSSRNNNSNRNTSDEEEDGSGISVESSGVMDANSILQRLREYAILKERRKLQQQQEQQQSSSLLDNNSTIGLRSRLTRTSGATGAGGGSERSLLSTATVMSPLRRSVITSTFNPWENHHNHTTNAKAYVKQLDRELILDTWGILYCGGSKPVEKALKKISFSYKIDLNKESFAW